MNSTLRNRSYDITKMSGFPLYDNLIKDISKKDLSVKEKEKFVENISKINMDGIELIYVLIYMYSEQNEDSADSTKVPYNGYKDVNEDGTNTFSWVFTQFPIKLRRLLSLFVNIHLEKQKEEQTRSVQTF